jgi:hypothetical protein
MERTGQPALSLQRKNRDQKNNSVPRGLRRATESTKET